MPDDELTNAGDEWPSYDVPTEVGHEDSADPAGQPPASTPASAATPPVAPAGVDGGQPPAQPIPPPGGAADSSDPNSASVPKYRLDETTAERDRLRSLIETSQAQIETLTALVRRFTAGGVPPVDPNAPAAEPTISPEDQAVRDRLLQVFPQLAVLDGPELKELLARRGEVLGVSEDAHRWRATEQAITDQFVESSIDKVFSSIAAHTLGEGKTAADLPDMVKDGALSAFARWVKADPKRAMRYERHDDTVVEEFWTSYKAAVYDPVKRDTNAQLLARAGSPPAVPRGGSQPLASPPAPGTPNPHDEDGIHAAAWNLRDEVGASR